MRYFADLALLDHAVEEDVLIDIGGDGTISAVTPNSTGPGERIRGFVVPGMPNLHSHAFQRAMAGLAESAGPGDFWRWRDLMYRFLSMLTPDDVQAIAAQLYVECLLHGYTSVAEFHYLHNAPDGSCYDDPAEMSHRVIAAAQTAGIGLTLLPVLYCRSQFGGAPPTEGQRRFVLTPDRYADLCATVARSAAFGIAPHSLRAVTPSELSQAIAIADTGEVPIHIHVAEQEKEVADCIAWSGARPVNWLLDHAPVGTRWCLIHATHIDASERLRLASGGAVAGLCPTTEANLGDGIFPLHAFLTEGGRFGIGSDSNVGTSPAEELRWLDYVGRLQSRTRVAIENSYVRALAGGAQALGRNAGAIAAGKTADLVVLDTGHPALVGRSGYQLIDSWLFGGNSTPVRDVMVSGRWVVRDGRHHAQEAAADTFARTMRRLAASL